MSEGCDDIKAAVSAEQSAEKPDENKRSQIIKDAVHKGCVDCIPDDWGVDT